MLSGRAGSREADSQPVEMLLGEEEEDSELNESCFLPGTPPTKKVQ